MKSPAAKTVCGLLSETSRQAKRPFANATQSNNESANGRQRGGTFPSPPLTVSDNQEERSNVSPHRILIADDDALVRGSLAAVLESEGYLVDEARDGIEAISRSIENRPNLVLLDLNMPNWNGWTAFSQLDRVTPLLPVIVITARPNQYAKAVRLGVDAFMEKPLNIPRLMNAIKQLICGDKNPRLRRVSNPSFVTELLGSADPSPQAIHL